MAQTGDVLLFGSGEIAPSGRRGWVRALSDRSKLRVAIMETPAGFQPNSETVARQIGDFLLARFPDRQLQITLVPARRQEQADDPQVIQPLAHADLIFLGPGSPTYAVRHLEDTLALEVIRERWLRHGATLVLASASVLAASQFTLPVYEIFKVGEDLHWLPGLALLPWVVIPHWNNREGGADLDTRRCFMGLERFERLRAMLPPDIPVLGLDEHTALWWRPAEGTGEVVGKGRIHWLAGDEEQEFAPGDTIPLMAEFPSAPLSARAQEWLAAQVAVAEVRPPDGVLRWLEQREAARKARDWARADALRERIQQAGWQVQDTPDGPRLLRR